jgi:hypothetical protein
MSLGEMEKLNVIFSETKRNGTEKFQKRNEKILQVRETKRNTQILEFFGKYDKGI